ncbi:hypothetical protein C9374_003734 [Naegleria lovaniensis]|uniref:EF-hand domain-containing protein n=1 Tax=Naegleria lovaniensis TaxID=51637 RepID=A0AA88KYF9_NAELO|nr:uncharacterized protein C9374_003734 [Naegleria lovaniensis]KAG2393970.1 hypothetical protein C9374_003734 [Naegleria lovaniensis]
MDKVKEIRNNFPDTTEVSLESCGLSSLDDVLNVLGELVNLRVLRLSNNRLTKLPTDMSRLSKVEYLDLTGNHFDSIDDILPGLCSLPMLKHLDITMAEADEDELIINLANLLTFNGTPLTDIPDQKYEYNEESVSPIKATDEKDSVQNPMFIEVNDSDFDSSRKLFEATQLYLGLRESFVHHTADVVSELKQRTKTETDPIRYHNEVTNANRIIFDRCFESIIAQVSRNDKKLASIMMILKNSYSGLLEDSYNFMDQSIQEFGKRVRSMQKDLDGADQEIGQLLEAAEALQQTASDSESAKRKILVGWEKEREQLGEEIGFLKNELEKYKNRLTQFQLNKQKIATQITTSPSKILKSVSPSNNSFKISQLTINTNTKSLTLRQLKDTIEEIYASKQKFDEKCSENKLPRETMEQYLYTFLNQKYGLKNLILEYASSIIQGVKRYSHEDNDVAVFGKIIRNEIDEEFRFVQKQLKETVSELLKVFLRGKYAKKLDSEISAMHQQRMNGELNEEEWVDIVKYMYNKEDSLNIIMKVTEAVQAIQTKLNRGNSRISSPSKSIGVSNKIPFKIFMKVLLTYQLRGHEQFLYKFVKLFRQVDSDKNGVLSESEFKQLLATINPNRTETEYNQWLNYVDPWNNQQITFSECVTFLSAELLKLVNEKTSQGTNESDAIEEQEEYDFESNANEEM